MLEREEASSRTIDTLESRLRVLAGCAATIVTGWGVFAATQIVGSSGVRALFWAGACGACVYDVGNLLARTFGRQRSWLVWGQTAMFSLMLPFYIFVSRAASPPASQPVVNDVFQTNGNYLPLATASTVALFILAILGHALERKRTPAAR